MFRLPDLPYAYSDLAPVISEQTLRTHHGKHHARYVEATNELLAEAGASAQSLEAVILSAHRSGARTLFNNAAQAWNHGFFWNCMRPGRSEPTGELADAIKTVFGDLGGLRKAFAAEGAAHFGSGWVWLTLNNGALSVISTHDAGLPITDPGAMPLLVCDLWEHAYYLDYKNDRAGFLEAWWEQLANWDFVGAQYAAARNGAAGWRYPAD